MLVLPFGFCTTNTGYSPVRVFKHCDNVQFFQTCPFFFKCVEACERDRSGIQESCVGDDDEEEEEEEEEEERLFGKINVHYA